MIGSASTIRQAALAMRERGGTIVAISSAGAAAPEKSMATYSSTKAALDMLVKCAAMELGPYGIRVNSIRPGFVPHGVLDQVFPEELQRELVEHTPLRRPGKPEEIGDMVVYLAGSGGSWITGQVIAVDGGMTAKDALFFENEDGERIEPAVIRKFKLNLLGERTVDAS